RSSGSSPPPLEPWISPRSMPLCSALPSCPRQRPDGRSPIALPARGGSRCGRRPPSSPRSAFSSPPAHPPPLRDRTERTASMIETLLAVGITAFARVVTGVRGNWQGCAPEARQRVYFANHASHGDFVLIWTVLPTSLRRCTRPVAGADYWMRGRLRR